MKTKLLALLLLAGSSLFAGPRFYVGFGFGYRPVPRYYYVAPPPPPPPVVTYYAQPVAPVVYYGPRAPWPGAIWVGPRWYGGHYYRGYWRRHR